MTYRDSNRLPVNRKLLTRLFSKIKVSSEHFYEGVPCWEWQAFRDKDGYGKTGYQPIDGKRYTPGVHRLMYQLFVEIIPFHLVTDHLCRNRCCCNPVHIEPVTVKVNTLRSPISPASLNALKTHCSNGHPFTDEHLATSPSLKERKCRTCFNIWQSTPQQKERKRQWAIKNRLNEKSAYA